MEEETAPEPYATVLRECLETFKLVKSGAEESMDPEFKRFEDILTWDAAILCRRHLGLPETITT